MIIKAFGPQQTLPGKDHFLLIHSPDSTRGVIPETQVTSFPGFFVVPQVLILIAVIAIFFKFLSFC